MTMVCGGIEAIVLAGGLGTRLRGVVPNLPKAMAPVGGRPFLEFVLHGLASRGVTRVVLALGYQAAAITAYFGSEFDGMAIVHSIEDQPLGTGGATRLALGRCELEHVFVLNGDTYVALEVGNAELCWRAWREPLIVVREVVDTERYGRVEARDERVVGFSEKGISGPGLINAGCYVFPRNLLDEFPLGSAFALEADFLVHAVQRQPYRLLRTEGIFLDIGIPTDYLRAETVLRRMI
ncbi:MAG: sugar phosphate nucleotidyltransferase [Alphaproteobacteria bacterium]|nr:sugar phosphate nucleotidyltransferase [Alphaproteobacteria bacterium]